MIKLKTRSVTVLTDDEIALVSGGAVTDTQGGETNRCGSDWCMSNECNSDWCISVKCESDGCMSHYCESEGACASHLCEMTDAETCNG